MAWLMYLIQLIQSLTYILQSLLLRMQNFSINSDPLILKSCTAHNKIGSIIIKRKKKKPKENEHAICPNGMNML